MHTSWQCSVKMRRRDFCLNTQTHTHTDVRHRWTIRFGAAFLHYTSKKIRATFLHYTISKRISHLWRISVFVCLCVCMCLCLYICVYMCVNTCMCTCVYLVQFQYFTPRVYIYTCTYTCTYVCIYVYTCIYIYIYIYVYIP